VATRSRLLLLAHRVARSSRSLSDSQGFSLLVVVLILLITSMGILALLNRSSSARLAAAYGTQRREAVQVAKSGLVQIIGELNKPANRGMLVSGVPLNGWNDSANFNAMENPCRRPPFTETPTPTTAQARAFGGNTPQNLVEGDPSRRYILRSIRYSSAGKDLTDRNHWIQSEYDEFGSMNVTRAGEFLDRRSDISDATNGFFVVEVEGQVLTPNGGVLSRARVTQEYVVVPKCCGHSFNGQYNAFDNGTDDIKGTDATDCFITVTGGSFITEANGDQSGSISLSQSYLEEELIDGTRQLMTNFNCITSATSCRGTDGSPPGYVDTRDGSVSAETEPTPLNGVPAFPDASISAGSIRATGNQVLYLRVNPAGDQVEACSPLVNTNQDTTSQLLAGAVTLSGCSPAPYCAFIANDIAEHHCRLTDFSATGNGGIFVDTSGGTIAVYLDGDSTESISGGAALIHLYCDAYPGENLSCPDIAAIEAFDRFSIYSQRASLTVNGNPVALSAFIYLRNGTLRNVGGSLIQGAAWINNYDSTGNSRLVTPASNYCIKDSKGFCILVSNDTVNDWIARSVSRIRVY
jgi:hypothetical protein